MAWVDMFAQTNTGGQEFRCPCGLAMPRGRVDANPTWVIASHDPSTEPYGANGNRRADAWVRKQASRVFNLALFTQLWGRNLVREKAHRVWKDYVLKNYSDVTDLDEN